MSHFNCDDLHSVYTINNSDVFKVLSSDESSVRLIKLGINNTNTPTGWNYFSVLKVGSRAFAFSADGIVDGIAFSQCVHGVWGGWELGVKKSDLSNIIISISPQNSNDIPSDINSMWDKFPTDRAFIGWYERGGKRMYIGSVYGTRLYGAVLVLDNTGNIYICRKSNGVYSSKRIIYFDAIS